jgi:Bacterial archaeo-eukaryotic release factor family 10
MITAETVNGIVRFQANGPEDRIQNRVDEQTKRHFRRAAGVIDPLLRTDGYDVLVAGGHEHELPEFLRFLPYELRGLVAGTFPADPATTPVAEVRGSAEGIVPQYQRGEDERLVDQVLELAAAGGPAAIGLQDYLAAAKLRFPPPPPDQGG